MLQMLAPMLQILGKYRFWLILIGLDGELITIHLAFN